MFPSLTETFGNVISEAIASGLAVLSYDKAAAKELITNGENGMVVSPGDELAFVNAGISLALDKLRMKRIRQAAAPSISHLSWEAIYNSFEETMINVIERHATTNPRKIDSLMPMIYPANA